MDAFVDVSIPIGMGYPYKATGILGVSAAFKAAKTYVKDSFTSVTTALVDVAAKPELLRVENMFVFNKANAAEEYVIFDTAGGTQVDLAFELKDHVNTLELPSVNPFYLTLGYKIGNEVYHIESVRLDVNMLLPAQAQLVLTKFDKVTPQANGESTLA